MNENEYKCLKDHEKTPTKVIGRVKTIGGLYNREVYVNFLKRLENAVTSMKDENVELRTVTFPYDWTRSNIESAHRLYYTLVEAGIYDKIVLIAHSMGGLVCRYMLENVLTFTDCSHEGRADRERLASKIALLYGIGVPHYGCVKSLHHLVDPEGGRFSELCRQIATVYEMIPFSDLPVQVEGLLGDVVKRKRRRSEIFMRDGEEITVNPSFWRLGERLRQRAETDVDIWNYKEGLIRDLISRFPVLNGHIDELFRGMDFHLSLNTDRKPPGCVYLLVNATGVTSPSGIDRQGHLEMHCSRGDGTVCSVVPNKERKWRVLGHRIKHNIDRSTMSTSRTEHVYTHNVHVSMLNTIDLTTPIRYFALSNKTEQTAHNVGDILWNLVRDEKINHVEHFRVFSEAISRFADAIKPRPRKAIGLSSSTRPFDLNSNIELGPYRLKTYNLDIHQLCIVSLEKKSLLEDNVEGKPIIFVFEKVDKKKRPNEKDFARIAFHTEGYDRSWNGLRVVMPGFYRLVSVAQDS